MGKRQNFALERLRELRAEKRFSERTFVLPGSYREFEDWCRENGMRASVTHCLIGRASIESLPGELFPIRIIRCGTWWKNPLARDPLLKAVEKSL